MNCERCPHPEHPGRVCGFDVTAEASDWLRFVTGVPERPPSADLARLDNGQRVLITHRITTTVTCACGQDD